ncbi:thioesterase-like superfamily-domain-containing protein [Aspergillus falconensis]
MKPRAPRRAGRPRLDASSDAIHSDDRRAQIRRAQRTYRLKKEADFRNATARAEQLEVRMRAAVEEVALLSKVAAEAQLHLSHPDICARLKQLTGILADGDSLADSSSPAEPSPGSSGHQVPVFNPPVQSPRQYPLPLPPSPPPLPPTRQYTYALQEVRFARKLQRYCLEHAYRLFTDSRSDPREIYRMFRLVPCVRDRGKTQPRFRQILMGGCTDPLEVPSLPFYSVGGAGTHFPDLDEEGNAIYPVNSRMPRRVLGVLPWADLGTKGDEAALEVHGLGGEWFDSRDVEGYLGLHGVDVNGGLFPMQRIPNGAAERVGSRSYVLDVEGFFSRLLSGVVILGRAPGFKKTDVKRALQASVSGMASLKAQIAVEPIGTDHYRSVLPPIRMGDFADWAYGGNILAIAVQAAYSTVTADQHLHSISGYFVRPASPSQKLICRVERIRDTRTFQTRQLRVAQSGAKAELLCLIATADFHIDEPDEMVNYAARPQITVPSSPAAETETENTPEPGLYRNLDMLMEGRPHFANRDGKGVSDIVSAERLRVHGALHTEADRVAALAFCMDRGLAYIPANHSGYSLSQASACATLDFALRVLTHHLYLQDWHVSERQTCGARNARALSEGRIFDGDGRLLAIMTQTTILRPKKGASRI